MLHLNKMQNPCFLFAFIQCAYGINRDHPAMIRIKEVGRTLAANAGWPLKRRCIFIWEEAMLVRYSSMIDLFKVI
jgi:hypothetical protein